MKRGSRFVLGMICALVLLTGAWLVPAHFRAVDAKVLERAGIGTPSLLSVCYSFVKVEKAGPASLLVRAAEIIGIPGHEPVRAVVTRLSRLSQTNPLLPGSDVAYPQSGASNAAPSIIDVLMQRQSRERMIQFLQTSPRAGVQEILKNRALTNTVQFAPAMLPSGQPLDAAITLAALFSQGERFPAPLREKVEFLAAHANRGGNTEMLEVVYLDLLSLGQRMDESQLTEFVAKVTDTNVLHALAEAVRASEAQLPLIYAMVVLSGQPGQVTSYWNKFGQTGIDDLNKMLRYGQGALNELCRRQQRLVIPDLRTRLIAYPPFGAFFRVMLPICRVTPWAALVFKCALFLAGAFCLARTVGNFARVREASDSKEMDHAQIIQDAALAVCTASLVVLATEPFLVSDSARIQPFIRWQLPVAGGAIVSQIQNTIQPVMTAVTLTPLIVFFVLQALIYVCCLLKVSEIRKQPLSPAMKLKLLENEEHLFDAGLYLGFAGTVISLILVSVGIVKQPSLMAAYSSTAFGIIFVSILKIFHLRPLRRELILQAEVQQP